MAKNKFNLSTITKIIVLVLSTLTILSFFLPAFGPKDADRSGKYSHCQICFLSQEAATEKASDLRIDATAELAKGNTEKAEKLNAKAQTYSFVATIKDSDFDGRTSAVTGAWFHFVAAVASLFALAATLLSLFGTNTTKLSIITLIIAILCIIASLICGFAFLGTEVGSTTVGESMNFRFGGIILGLISSVIACLLSFIPCFSKKKKSKK